MKQDFPSDYAYQAAAWMLMCSEAAIRAVAEVEAGLQGAFLEDGAPVVLFERHKFHKGTAGRFDGARAEGVPESCAVISSAKRGGYGPYSAQHRRLQAAVALDSGDGLVRAAALRSCSWGLFQIMGSNHQAAGYPELQRFITAMFRSVDDHLRAFVMFIRNDWRLTDAVRDLGDPYKRVRAAVTFASIYNGPAYAENKYDTKIVKAVQAYDRILKKEEGD